jgi:L-fuculokinase
LLFSEDGTLLQSRSTANAPVKSGAYLHADTDRLETFIVASLQDLNAIEAIGTISITTHGAAGALINDDGLVLPILDYEETAVDTIEAEYAPFRPAFGESFSTPMGGGLNLGKAFFFLKHRFPEAFRKAKHLLAYPQYWGWRLTGQLASDVTSLGCHTDLWVPLEARPSSMATANGFDRLMPPLKPPFAVLGSLKLEIAEKTSIVSTCKVLTGIHDSNASLVPYLATRPGPFTVVSTGTWIVLLHVGGDLAALDPTADMMANVDATGTPVACAKFMGGREYAAIAGDAHLPADLAIAADLIHKGIMAIPSFSQQGGPYSGRIGRINQSNLAASERAALASLYCALMTDDQLTRLRAKGPILVDGNLARNACYLGTLAALRPEQPVEAAANSAGTAEGAAALAVWPKPLRELALEPIAVANLPGLEEYRRRWRAAIDRSA